MSALESAEIWGDDALDPEILLMSNEELRQRIRLLDNDIRIMRSDIQRINHESNSQRERIKENNEKIKLNKQLPYLVANVVEVRRMRLTAREDMVWMMTYLYAWSRCWSSRTTRTSRTARPRTWTRSARARAR